MALPHVRLKIQGSALERFHNSVAAFTTKNTFSICNRQVTRLSGSTLCPKPPQSPKPSIRLGCCALMLLCHWVIQATSFQYQTRGCRLQLCSLAQCGKHGVEGALHLGVGGVGLVGVLLPHGEVKHIDLRVVNASKKALPG